MGGRQENIAWTKDFVKENDYMYTIASRVDITEEFIEKARVMLYDFYANKGLCIAYLTACYAWLQKNTPYDTVFETPQDEWMIS